ncbi:MAG: hypothetical protein ACRD0G_17430 [Acidimicrobiales bacterium]
MATIAPASMTAPPSAPLLIEPRRRPAGPRVGRLLKRTAVGFGVLWLIGSLPVILGAGHAVTAFGLGLWFPGAGFLYSSDVPLLVLTLVLFAVAFLAWFGSGNLIAPLAVWLAAAGGAAARATSGPWEWAEIGVPVITLAVVAVGLVGREREFRRARRRAEDRNRYLVRHTPVRAPHAAERRAREATVEDLAHARFALDLALQPHDDFTGYEFVDQFQTASVRYQINFNQYALAFYQATCAPAFRGYLALAQRNAIEKVTHPRVWRYWRLENLWGNLDPNPDPIRRDNIMLSGYLGLMLGLYESGNADPRYSDPGALIFAHGDRRFAYDYGTICEALVANFRRARLGQFACEPNWVYASCNATGFNSLVLHDRLHGTTHAAELYDSYRRSVLDEFTTTDGRITAIRSSRMGFTIPSLTSTMADAGTVCWMTPTLADLANRTWAIVRNELVLRDRDGTPSLALRGWDKIDVGSYKPSDVTAHIMCLSAAREMGDETLAGELQAIVDARFQPRTVDGVTRYEAASTFSNLAAVVGRFNRVGGWSQNVAEGPDPRVVKGPYLDDAPYPQVLVARADTDGAALDLVLQPGGRAGRYAIMVRGLHAGSDYQVRGAVDIGAVADVSGAARLEVDVVGRTEVRVAPSP